MSGKFLNGIIAYGDINLKNGNINISNNSQIQSPNAGELKFVHANTTNGFTIKTVENASNDVYKLALGTTNGIDSYSYEFPNKNGIVALTSDIDTAIDDLKTDILLKDSDTAQVILSDISFEGLVSVDNLAIEALTATSLNVTNDATFAGSIDVKDIIATNSIKINDDNVALAKDIPDISGKADKATTLAGYGITDAVKTRSNAEVSKLTIFAGTPDQAVFEEGSSDYSGIILKTSYQTANYCFDQNRFSGTQKVATLNDIPNVANIINNHAFTNNINLTNKTTISTTIDPGELKVTHNGSNNGFIIKSVSPATGNVNEVQIIATNGSQTYYQYRFPLKSGTIALTSDLTSKADSSSVYTKTESDEKYLQHIPASLANDTKGNIIDDSNTAVGKLEYNQSGKLFLKFGNDGTTYIAGDNNGLNVQIKDQLNADTFYNIDFPKKSGTLVTDVDLSNSNNFFSEAISAQNGKIEELESQKLTLVETVPATSAADANIYGFYGSLKAFGITGGNVDIRELSIKVRTAGTIDNANVPVWARVLKNVNNTWVIAAQSVKSHTWSESAHGEFLTFKMKQVGGNAISAYEKVAIVFVNNESAAVNISNGAFGVSNTTGLGGGALVSAIASAPNATAASASVTPILKFKYFQFGDTEETLKLTGGTLTGALKMPTPAVGTNNTTVATTAFVNTALSGYVKTANLPDFATFETVSGAESKYVLKTDISNVYKYIGSVDTYSALPTTGQNVGDVYNIINADSTNNIAAGDNVAWTGSAWDKLGGSVDLSNYAEKSTTLAGYGITDVYTKAEIDSKNVSFLTKESSGIQTISSDLALTGYVLIDNLAIDELNIESLTATSKVTLSGGLEVSNGLVADSIKIGDDAVALAKDIPNTSSYITKDADNLTYYEKKTDAEGKYVKRLSDETQTLTGIFEFKPNLLSDESSKSYAKFILSNYAFGDNSTSSGNNVGDNVALKLTNINGWGFEDSLIIYGNGAFKTSKLNPDTESTVDSILYLPNKSGTIALTSDIPDISGKADKSTTLAGYGITNAYTKTEADNKFLYLNNDNTLELIDTGIGPLKIKADYNNSYVKFRSDGINYNTDPGHYDPGTPKGTLYYPDLLSQFATIATDLDLENYETKTVAEAKYALKEEIPEVPTTAKYEIPAKTPSSNKIVWTITLDEEPDVAPIMQVFNKNGDVVYANITYVAGVITVVINSATACAEGDYYIIVSGQTGNNGYRTKVISNGDFTQAVINGTIDLNTIYYIV